jgi:hypothetical protein
MKKLALAGVAMALTSTAVVTNSVAPPVYHPSISHLTVNPQVLGDHGGNIRVSAKISHAITCLLEVSPEIRGMATVTPCGPTIRRTIQVPRNGSHRVAAYRFALTAYKTSTSHSKTATFTVQVKATPGPKPKPRPPVTTTTTTRPAPPTTTATTRPTTTTTVAPTTTTTQPPPVTMPTTTTTVGPPTPPPTVQVSLSAIIADPILVNGVQVIPDFGGAVVLSGAAQGSALQGSAATACTLTSPQLGVLEDPVPFCTVSDLEETIFANTSGAIKTYEFDLTGTDGDVSKTASVSVEQYPDSYIAP